MPSAQRRYHQRKLKTIKINFSNWWGFGIEEWRAMFSFLDYNFVLSLHPDYVIFSNTAERSMPTIHCERRVKKIFFMGEIIDVDMSKCDWAFGDNYVNSPRHFRMPYYVIRMLYTGTPLDSLIKNIDTEQVKYEKTKFCNFLFSNTRDGETRNRFFKELSKYKKVDSAGTSFNNMGFVLGGRQGTKVGGYTKYPEKMRFLRDYKFTIAFENNRSDYNPNSGYTTEKLTEPMLVNSIPIYRGNPRIGEEFNTNSFFNYYDFRSEKEFIDYIIEVDKNDYLYEGMLEEPWLLGNKLTKQLDVKAIKRQFEKIFR